MNRKRKRLIVYSLDTIRDRDKIKHLENLGYECTVCIDLDLITALGIIVTPIIQTSNHEMFTYGEFIDSISPPKKVTLYTIGCSNCLILENKLNQQNITYEKVTDPQQILDDGIETLPVLKIGNVLMDYKTAREWLEYPKGIEFREDNTKHENQGN